MPLSSNIFLEKIRLFFVQRNFSSNSVCVSYRHCTSLPTQESRIHNERSQCFSHTLTFPPASPQKSFFYWRRCFAGRLSGGGAGGAVPQAAGGDPMGGGKGKRKEGKKVRNERLVGWLGHRLPPTRRQK